MAAVNIGHPENIVRAGLGWKDWSGQLRAWEDAMRVLPGVLLVTEMSVAGDGRTGTVFDQKERCLSLYQWK